MTDREVPFPNDKITETVSQRVKDADKFAGGKDGSGEIDSSFISECLKKNELGDGELFKKLFRNDFVFNPFKVNLAVMPHMLLSKPDHCAGKALKACTICVRYDIHDGTIRYQGIKPAQCHEFRLNLVCEHPELSIFRGMGVDREWAVRLQITQQSDGLGWVPYFQSIIGFSGSRGLAGTMAAGV